MTTPKGQQAEGSWTQMKGRLKEAWGALTDDDLDRHEGRREQLVGMIEEKTGKSREAINKKLDEIAKKVKHKF